MTSSTVTSFFGDIGNALVGGGTSTLFRLHFDLPAPRPTSLEAAVNRQGVGSHVGLLIYSAQLSKSVSSEVNLEDPRFFGKSKFVEDESTAQKLNAKSALIKQSNEMAAPNRNRVASH